MDSPATPPAEVAAPDADPDTDVIRVAHAAAELGVPVPPGFWLTGMDPDGSHRAHHSGTAGDIRHGVAILARLDGQPVDECLAAMTAEPKQGESLPEWEPPADWNDTEAMLAYLAERERHPEWPQFTNSLSDWAQLVAAFLGGQVGIKAIAQAATSIHNERARLAFAKHVVDRAAAQGVELNPADLIRAINPSAVTTPATTSNPDDSKPTR